MASKLINIQSEKPVHLVLARDRVRSVKRGHPWVFEDYLKDKPKNVKPGALALLKAKDGEILSKGYYDPQSKLAFRSFVVNPKERLDDQLVQSRLERAARLRSRLFNPEETNGFRLVNGEGDGLPGQSEYAAQRSYAGLMNINAWKICMKIDADGRQSPASASCAYFTTRPMLACVRACTHASSSNTA